MDDATKAVLERVRSLHAAMGAAIVKEGDYHECEQCSRTQPLTAALAAEYLRRGWPRCCGEGMKQRHAQQPPP